MIDWPNGPKTIQYLGGTKNIVPTKRDEARMIVKQYRQAAGASALAADQNLFL
jgi:hypothetical protein